MPGVNPSSKHTNLTYVGVDSVYPWDHVDSVCHKSKSPYQENELIKTGYIFLRIVIIVLNIASDNVFSRIILVAMIIKNILDNEFVLKWAAIFSFKSDDKLKISVPKQFWTGSLHW